ncbi:AraC family transcriptional regulator [Vibrio salinus]|uniref:AraC family transcriptional regulator n=1 Tax=Vibrio salinus TaxID=2899784 RepID=UPI001E47872E|nr:AraC family transcriptional regulator [Vibrio salinus]MCE0494492.1 AraC family transcriptional regulator [Vibrio salinus]
MPKRTKKFKEDASFTIAAELGGLEMLHAKYKRQNFSRHSHEGYTIGVIEKGAQSFYRSGGNHLAPKDHIILVNADEVHTGHSATEGGWEYKAIYPLPEQFSAVTQGIGAHSSVPYFPEPVVHDPLVAQQLRLVFSTLENSDNRLLRETLIYGALVKLMARHSRSRQDYEIKKKGQKQVLIVKTFLDDFPQADVSLEELASLAGFSPYYLVRAFQKEFGLPPHAYQIQSRLRYAKKLLRAGYVISDAAQEAGFHDQSHFHRHFKRAMGITPKQFTQSLS